MRCLIAIVIALINASAFSSDSAYAVSPDERYQAASNLSAAKSKSSLEGLSQDFYLAANSPTVGEARIRWEKFLKSHGPGETGFEDAFHLSHYRVGELELMRVYYLLGDQHSGDVLFIKIMERLRDAP